MPEATTTIPAVQDVVTKKSKDLTWVWLVLSTGAAIGVLYLVSNLKEASPTLEVKKSQDALPIHKSKLDQETNQVDDKKEENGGSGTGDKFI